MRKTAAALDTLRTRHAAEQAALGRRLDALQAEAERAHEAVAAAAEWRDTLRLVRAQVASLQATAAAQQQQQALTAMAVASAQQEAYEAGLQALSRMDGVLTASVGYLGAYHAALEEQRTLNLWAEPEFRSLWDAADRLGTTLGLAVAGYSALEGGEASGRRIGIGLAAAAAARLVGWVFGGGGALRPEGVRTRLEFVAITRAAFDDIAISQAQSDSLRRANTLLLGELAVLRERYVVATPTTEARAAVLGALVPYLDRYVDALRQPVLLVSARRAALSVYATYDLPADRRAALLALVESLRETERGFAAALRADALEVDRLRVLLERAATGALLSELSGTGTVVP